MLQTGLPTRVHYNGVLLWRITFSESATSSSLL